MKKAPLILAGVLVLAFAAAVLWYRSVPSRVAPRGTDVPMSAAAGQPAPSFSLNDVNGNAVSSALFQGKPTVINFFASWCPPCREEIPGFVEVYNKYRGRGFELVGISLDKDTRRDLPRLMMENRIEYRVLLGDVAVARAYGGVSSIPTTFFVGRDGRIRNVHVGYMDAAAFEDEVRKLL